MYNTQCKVKKQTEKREKMNNTEKFESTVKYLIESKGYTELQAAAEAFRILVTIELNKAQRKQALSVSH